MNKRMYKRILVTMCLFIVASTLFGCTTNQELYPLVTKTPEELTLEDLTVNIDGANLSVLRRVEDIVQANQGVVSYNAFNPETLAKGGLLVLDIWNESNFRFKTTIIAKKFIDKEAPKEDARIKTIVITPEAFNTHKIILPNQFVYGSSPEEVIDKCGQPMRVSIKENTMNYFYYNTVKLNEVSINITFKDGQLNEFSYQTTSKTLPEKDVSSFDTEEVSGIKPILDVTRISEGREEEILKSHVVMMGDMELKDGIALGQFIEEGWKSGLTVDNIQDLVDVQLQRGEDKCVVTLEKEYTNQTPIKKILITSPLNKELLPTFPGNVDGTNMESVLENYGMPANISMANGVRLGYQEGDFRINVAYDSNATIDSYSCEFNHLE